MQATDFERERKNLQDLIGRLEVHLSEQTKLVEEVNDLFSFDHLKILLIEGTMESIAISKTYGSYARCSER